MKITICFKKNSPYVVDFSCRNFVVLDGQYRFYGVKTDYELHRYSKNINVLSLTRKRIGLEIDISKVSTMRVE